MFSEEAMRKASSIKNLNLTKDYKFWGDLERYAREDSEDKLVKGLYEEDFNVLRALIRVCFSTEYLNNAELLSRTKQNANECVVLLNLLCKECGYDEYFTRLVLKEIGNLIHNEYYFFNYTIREFEGEAFVEFSLTNRYLDDLEKEGAIDSV